MQKFAFFMLQILLIFSGVEQGSIVGEPAQLTSGEEGFYFKKYQFFEAHTQPIGATLVNRNHSKHKAKSVI
ncbi:hypothetical protein T06_5430 [Trichinella sp. T6]|nr:hypothetical protein T06_5430 [Trichinella sp. T6]